MKISWYKKKLKIVGYKKKLKSYYNQENYKDSHWYYATLHRRIVDIVYKNVPKKLFLHNLKRYFLYR